MGEDKKQGFSYIVPRNVATKFEFIPGFGWKEFIITACGLGIGGVLFLLISLVPTFPAPLKVIVSLIPAIGAFMVSRRDPNNNQSMLFLLQGLMEYNKKQHRFIYKYNSGNK